MRKAMIIATCAWSYISALPAQALNCDKAITQFEMNQCVAHSFNVADRELNEVWQKIKTNYSSGKTYEKLLDAQRKWIAFRDADCDGAVGALWEGGSAAPMAIIGCKATLTKARVKALKNRYLNR